MTSGEPGNATRGMTRESAALLARQPTNVQRAYLAWWTDRANRKASHRDTLEPFIAGWQARPSPRPVHR